MKNGLKIRWPMGLHLANQWSFGTIAWLIFLVIIFMGVEIITLLSHRFDG